MLQDQQGVGRLFVRRIIKNYEILFFIKEKYDFLKVIWCYGQWHDLYNEKIGSDIFIKYLDSFPNEADIIATKPHLVVIDDLMNELRNNSKIANLFTKGSHNLNFTVIFIAQNMYHKSPVMRTISLNSHYLIAFKNPRNMMQIRNLSRQVNPLNPNFLVEAFKDACDAPHGYIKLDFTSDNPKESCYNKNHT